MGTPVEKWVQSPQDCMQHASKLPQVTQLRVQEPGTFHPNSSPDGLTFPGKQVPGLPFCSFLASDGAHWGDLWGWCVHGVGHSRIWYLSRGGQPCQGVLGLGQIPIDNSALPHHLDYCMRPIWGPFTMGLSQVFRDGKCTWNTVKFNSSDFKVFSSSIFMELDYSHLQVMPSPFEAIFSELILKFKCMQ